MNKPLAESDFATPKVTTGPIAGSRKVYSAPDAAPDLRVPLREIALSEAAAEEPVRIYDPSGIYTEADAAIDVEKGLKLAVLFGCFVAEFPCPPQPSEETEDVAALHL